MEYLVEHLPWLNSYFFLAKKTYLQRFKNITLTAEAGS
jgi:hypothetical protein